MPADRPKTRRRRGLAGSPATLQAAGACRLPTGHRVVVGTRFEMP